LSLRSAHVIVPAERPVGRGTLPCSCAGQGRHSVPSPKEAESLGPERSLRRQLGSVKTRKPDVERPHHA
jgi:hypothetical protein